MSTETKTQPAGSAMPFELVNYDDEMTWVRADGTTEGQAKQFFASESGSDFTEVRVRKSYMRDPGPTCVDCEDTATGGLRYHWKDSAPMERKTSESMLCDRCRDADLSSVPSTASKVEPISLEEATPRDGWKMLGCDADAPGATLYWERTDHA